MAGLYSIKGIGEKPAGMLNLYKDLGEMTEADMELAIAKQRLEIERNIVANMRGIGSAKVAEYDKAIDTINEFIGAIVNEDEAAVGAIIGKTKGKAKAFLKKVATKTTTAAKKAGSAVKTAAKKTGTAVKKAAVFTAKVVTAPAKLAMKGILELTLPSAAPAFLYVFIEDPKVVAALPPKVKKKRDKQIKFGNFVVNRLGMKREHYMGILRNGIMKRYGVSPEKRIAQMMEGRVAGIGSAQVVAVVMQAIKKIIDFIKKIKPKEPVESFDESDFPEDSDFGELTAAEQKALSKGTTGQKYAVEPGNSLNDEYGVDDSGGRRVRNICGF